MTLFCDGLDDVDDLHGCELDVDHAGACRCECPDCQGPGAAGQS